jgi:hypothetical protein
MSGLLAWGRALQIYLEPMPEPSHFEGRIFKAFFAQPLLAWRFCIAVVARGADLLVD